MHITPHQRHIPVGSCTMIYDSRTQDYVVWITEGGTVTKTPFKNFHDACFHMRHFILSLKRPNAQAVRYSTGGGS